MKTIKNIVAAAIAAFLCIGFTACEPPVNNAKSKRLGKLTLSTAGITAVEYTFSYDKNGNVTSFAFSVPMEQVSESIDCVWDKNTIKMLYDGEEEYVFAISDGLVRSADYGGDIMKYAYNSSRQLISCADADGLEKFDLSWQGKKLTKLVHTDDYGGTGEAEVETLNFVYGSQTCKGYIPVVLMMLPFDFDLYFMELALAQPKIVGLELNELPESVTSSYGSVNCSYSFDKDGYVETLKCAFDMAEMSVPVTIDCNFFWE